MKSQFKLESKTEPDSDLEPPEFIEYSRDQNIVTEIVSKSQAKLFKPEIIQSIECHSFGVDFESEAEELEQHRDTILPLLIARFKAYPQVGDARLLYFFGDTSAWEWAVELFLSDTQSDQRTHLPLVFLMAGKDEVIKVSGLSEKIVEAIKPDQWCAIDCAVKLSLPGSDAKYLDLLTKLPISDREYQAQAAADLPPSEGLAQILEDTLTATKPQSGLEDALVTQLNAEDSDLHSRAKILFEKLILDDDYYSSSIARLYFEHCQVDSLPFLKNGLKKKLFNSVFNAIECLIRLNGRDGAKHYLLQYIYDPHHGACALDNLSEIYEGTKDVELDQFLQIQFDNLKSPKSKAEVAIAIVKIGNPDGGNRVREWCQNLEEGSLDSYQKNLLNNAFDGITMERSSEILTSLGYSLTIETSPECEIDLFVSHGLGTIIEVDNGGCDIDDLSGALMAVKNLSNSEFDLQGYRCSQAETEDQYLHQLVVGEALYEFKIDNTHTWFDPYILIDIINLILEQESNRKRLASLPSDFPFVYIVYAEPAQLRVIFEKLGIRAR